MDFNDNLNIIIKYKNFENISNEEIEILIKSVEYINKNSINYINNIEYFEIIQKCDFENINIKINNIKNSKKYNFILETLIIQFFKFIKIFKNIKKFEIQEELKIKNRDQLIKEINKILNENDFYDFYEFDKIHQFYKII